MLQEWPTEIAVKVLSPVAMMVLMLQSFKMVIVGLVYSLSLFSITIMPRKVKLFSKLCRGRFFNCLMST